MNNIYNLDIIINIYFFLKYLLKIFSLKYYNLI